MGKIRNHLDPHYLASVWGKPLVDALLYVESGDPAALDSIKQTKGYEHWAGLLRKAMDPPSRCEKEDRRALQVLARSGTFAEIAEWVCQELPREQPDQDLHGLMRDALKNAGVTEQEIALLTVARFRGFQNGAQPTSAGRYVLALGDQVLKAAASHAPEQMLQIHYNQRPFLGLIEFLFSAAPERLDLIVPALLEPERLRSGTAALLLQKGGHRFEEQIAQAWRNVKDVWMRFEHSQLLVAHDPARYGAEALAMSRRDLRIVSLRAVRLDEILLWMLSTYGDEVIDDARFYLEHSEDGTWRKCHLLNGAVQAIGRAALPMTLALVNADLQSRKVAVSHLINLDNGTHADLIRSTLEACIDEAQKKQDEYQPGKMLVEWINLAAKWQPAQIVDKLWPLADHKAKRVRDAAARAIGKIGESIVPRTTPLLADKKRDRRAWAVAVLSGVGSPTALTALDARLDEEPDDEVRDAMLLALDAARAASGKQVTREEISKRVERAAKKLQSPITAWLDESGLPPLRYTDGTELGLGPTRFLLYRQSRAREIRPDVEARPLYALIDRQTSGDCALELFRQFAATKADASDRWVLTVAGMLGDDRIVPTLSALIQQWGDSARGRMAEYGVQALALLGTDAALTTVDAISLRYRVKNKNIGAAAVEAFAEAAERKGLSIDELGDLVVPWLGFSPGQPRLVDCGGKPFQVLVSPDFKLTYRDIDKNKPAKSLPKSAPKEILAQLKDESALLKDVAKGQVARIENLMVRQHRWPADRWRALFLDHPVLFPFATRLVWSAFDGDGQVLGSFRALEDHSLTTPSDDPFDLSTAATIGIVHPLELDDDARTSWQTHLADYEVQPPFPQLDRPVIRVKDDARSQKISRDYQGTSLNALTFRGRAEKLGWTRGSVNDGGSVDAYRKVFPGAGVEAFLGLDGLYMGIGREESITLENLSFVKGGSVQVGGYTYDRPTEESDARLIPFGEIPAVVFSEVMGDLARIAGQPVGGEDGEV